MLIYVTSTWWRVSLYLWIHVTCIRRRVSLCTLIHVTMYVDTSDMYHYSDLHRYISWYNKSPDPIDVHTRLLYQVTCIMAWLRLVGSLKLHVSFAKEPYKRNYILQKRPIILGGLLIAATPYYICWHTSRVSLQWLVSTYMILHVHCTRWFVLLYVLIRV